MHWLDLGHGEALLWVEDPPDPATLPQGASGSRLAGLVRALVSRPAGEPDELNTVTVLDAPRLDAQGLLTLVAALQSREPPPQIRIEADWTLPWHAAPLIESARACLDAPTVPFSVHGLIARSDSLTARLEQELTALAGAGIPLSAEIWLERGVNGEIGTLRDLVARLLGMRVRPYYLVDGEWLARDSRVPADQIDRLVRGLRGWISGTGVPQWLLARVDGTRDLLVPEYVRRLAPGEVAVEDYRGVERVYRNPAGR